MGSRLDRHLAAICLPMDPERLVDDLAANDGGATTSSYTEAGPRPGVCRPDQNTARLAPVISGGQGSDLELVTLAPGSPGLSITAGVQLGYRFADETDAQIRGWCPPNLPLGWSSPVWSDSTTYDDFDLVTLRDQRVILLYRDGSVPKVRRWDPSTAAWAAAVTVAPTSYNAIAALVRPDSGRVLVAAHADVWRSDDNGATWTEHARSIYSAATWGTWDRLRLAWSNGSILALAGDGNDVTQLASDDGLATLAEVVTVTGLGASVSCASLPSGALVIAYVRAPGDGFVCVRRLTTVWESIDDAGVIEVHGAGCSAVALTADPDGCLWCFVSVTASRQTLIAYVSMDGGATWERAEDAVMTTASGNTDFVTNITATPAAGAVHLAHNWTASTGDEDGSIGVAVLGGWSTLTAYPQLDAVGLTDGYPREGLLNRTGGGGSYSAGISPAHDSCTWLPIELPVDTGLFTAAGAGAEALVSGELMVGDSGAAAAARSYTRDVGASLAPRCAIGEMRFVTGAGSTADDTVILRVQISNGGLEHIIKLRISSTGFVVRDPNGGAPTLATVTEDMTAPMQLAISMDRAAGATSGMGVWYRRPYETEWTEAWSGQTTENSTTAAATSVCEFAHGASSQYVTAWKFLVFSEGVLGHDLGPAVDLSGNGVVGGLKLGRPIGAHPIPLHPETGDGTTASFLAATGGPGALGESFTVEADHDHPIEHVIPTVSPSPDERWRSTTTASDAIIAWDFGDETWIGDSLALPGLRCNFRQALLQYYDGATWQTAGTLDLATGFTSLSYSLAGDCLIPGASTTSGARWVQEGELAGGHVMISGVAYTIRWNTAGAWVNSSGATTPLVRVLLDGDLSAVASTGSVDICWPSGVLVVHGAAIVRARRWRVKIAASQAVVGGYYEAGHLVPYAVRGIGQPPSWGWSRETASNSDTRRSRYGTSRAKKLGPPPTSITWGWTDGVPLEGLRIDAQPDYLGSSVGLPLVGAGDVAWLLRGILERTDSGAVPVVALSKVPDASGTTITDRSLWTYGRLTGSVREDNAMGPEGTGEVQRVASITVDGLV